jgi:transposase
MSERRAGGRSVQEWAEVHRLFQIENRSKAAIAARLGMSRTTVYRLRALKEPPRYERHRRPSLLDLHKAKIAELFLQDAETADAETAAGPTEPVLRER